MSKITLSSFDFLGLADQRKVARVDLGKVGFDGLLYVRDLTSAEQQLVLSLPKNSRVKQYAKEKAFEFDAGLFATAVFDFLKYGMVTDKEGGAILERAFEAVEADGEAVEYVTVPEAQLVQMYDEWLADLKQPRLVREKIDRMSNVITNEIIRVIKEISGMTEDREQELIEEKKAS